VWRCWESMLQHCCLMLRAAALLLWVQIAHLVLNWPFFSLQTCVFVEPGVFSADFAAAKGCLPRHCQAEQLQSREGNDNGSVFDSFCNHGMHWPNATSCGHFGSFSGTTALTATRVVGGSFFSPFSCTTHKGTPLCFVLVAPATDTWFLLMWACFANRADLCGL